MGANAPTEKDLGERIEIHGVDVTSNQRGNNVRGPRLIEFRSIPPAVNALLDRASRECDAAEVVLGFRMVDARQHGVDTCDPAVANVSAAQIQAAGRMGQRGTAALRLAALWNRPRPRIHLTHDLRRGPTRVPRSRRRIAALSRTSRGSPDREADPEPSPRALPASDQRSHSQRQVEEAQRPKGARCQWRSACQRRLSEDYFGPQRRRRTLKAFGEDLPGRRGPVSAGGVV